MKLDRAGHPRDIGIVVAFGRGPTTVAPAANDLPLPSGGRLPHTRLLPQGEPSSLSKRDNWDQMSSVATATWCRHMVVPNILTDSQVWRR